jgi:sigma-B regulation protein RsbU (phosphoserine phosphatase)
MPTGAEVILALALLIALVGVLRLGASRRRDHAIIAGLQGVLTTPVARLPGVAIGSAVLFADPGAGVGGDLVDVFALDARFSMLLVADVSGNGVAAAAQTAFIKYTIRTLALESDGDPAVVLAKFNAIYARQNRATETFVVLILGIIDAQTGDVRYASAGHEPAYVRRRSGSVMALEPTGPIVGAAPFSAYGSDVVTLAAGDVLVWTTDGMTESRDRRRRLLGADGLADWVASAPRDAAVMADWLVASLRRRSAGVTDDVAVLVIAYEPASALTQSRGPTAMRGSLAC